MDALSEIPHWLSGLPWQGTLVIAVITVLCTKGIDALLRWRKSQLEERQYDDGQTKAGYDALVEALNQRIDELAKEVAEVKREAREDRLTASRALADEKAAHADCKIAVAELRAEIRVMQKDMEALKRHEKVQVKNVENINERIKQLDPTAELPPPIEPLNP